MPGDRLDRDTHDGRDASRTAVTAIERALAEAASPEKATSSSRFFAALLDSRGTSTAAPGS